MLEKQITEWLEAKFPQSYDFFLDFYQFFGFYSMATSKGHFFEENDVCIFQFMHFYTKLVQRVSQLVSYITR